jgi:hypothetical protein
MVGNSQIPFCTQGRTTRIREIAKFHSACSPGAIVLQWREVRGRTWCIESQFSPEGSREERRLRELRGTLVEVVGRTTSRHQVRTPPTKPPPDVKP